MTIVSYRAFRIALYQAEIPEGQVDYYLASHLHIPVYLLLIDHLVKYNNKLR